MITTQDFELHEVEGYISSIYLAVYGDKILLLDCGCRSDVPRIERYLRQNLGREPRDIELAIASHTHPDHAGGARILRRRHNVPIGAPRRINAWYRGPSGFFQHKIDTSLAVIVGSLGGHGRENIWYRRRTPVDHSLVHGDTLPQFSDWTVIEAPGHTSHDIVLYNREASVLYAADVIMKIKDKYIPPFPVLFKDKMSVSLDRVEALPVDTLAMAHGGIEHIDGLSSAVADLRKSLDSSLSKEMRRVLYLQQFSPEVRRIRAQKQ